MTATRKPPLVALLALALTGCGKWADDLFCESGGCGFSESEWARVASLANPGDPEPDLSNEVRDNPFVVGLGQKFFFDPAFSGNATQIDAIRRDSPVARAKKGDPIGISCATCHDLERGGADTTSSPGHVSVGAGWTDVNALSVLNSAYRQVVFWNGRADSLWALNAVVAESPQTLNGNRLNTAHVIASRYALEYAQVFDRLDVAAIAALPANGKPGNLNCDTDPAVIATEPFNDAYDCRSESERTMVTRILVNWSKAIAAYEYQLTSRNSPFDQFVTEGRDSTRISAAAKRGARLFVGKGACVDCHSGPQLTDEQFHDIGVPQTGITVPRTVDCPAQGGVCDCSDSTTNLCPPFGAWDGLRRLQGTKFAPARPNNWLRTGKWSGNAGDTSRKDYVDRSDKPDFDKLKGAWRTPSLRNVALTAPYMHDGAYASLKDVIWHYNNGAATAGPEQVGVPAPQIKPLMLTESEQEDLVAFLETLTGEPLPDDLRLPPPATGAGGTIGGVTGMGGTGTGGRAGTGGMGGTQATGGSSATGTGGAGGSAPPAACMSTKALAANITDFSEYTLGNPIRFGTPPQLTGRTFSYLVPAAPPNPSPASLTIGPGAGGSPALIVGAQAVPGAPPNNWYVFGLTFDSCVDASAYAGVQFTIGGVLTNCPPLFGVMSKETVSPAEDPRGTCQVPSVCMSFLRPITGSGTVMEPLPSTGSTSIIGVQWRVPVSCGAGLAIDDVAFAPPIP